MAADAAAEAAVPAPEGAGLATDMTPTAAVDAIFTEAGALPQVEFSSWSWQPYLALVALGLAAAIPAWRLRSRRRRLLATPEGVPI